MEDTDCREREMPRAGGGAAPRCATLLPATPAATTTAPAASLPPPNMEANTERAAAARRRVALFGQYQRLLMGSLRWKSPTPVPDEHVPTPTPIKNTSLMPTSAAPDTPFFRAFTTGGDCSAAMAADVFTEALSARVKQNPVTAGASGVREGAEEGVAFVRLAASATIAPMMPSTANSAAMVRMMGARRRACVCASGFGSPPALPSGSQQGARWASSEWPMGDTAASRSIRAGAGVRGGAPAGVCGENKRGTGEASSGLSGKGPVDMLAPLRA